MTKGAKGWETEGERPCQTRYSKLLVKDKPLYSVKEGRRTLREERNEVVADERQTGSGKLRGERLKVTAYKDQPAHKVSSWNPRWSNITGEKHQLAQMVAVETPRKENWDLSVKVQGAKNSLCCYNSHCFNSVTFKTKMSCKHGYVGHANMLYLFRKINFSWLSFTQSLIDVCVLIVILCVHILLLPTHVTFHRSLRLAPWCSASTLV